MCEPLRWCAAAGVRRVGRAPSRRRGNLVNTWRDAYPSTGLVVSGVDENAADVADGHGALWLGGLPVLGLLLLAKHLRLLTEHLCAVHVALLTQLLRLFQCL